LASIGAGSRDQYNQLEGNMTEILNCLKCGICCADNPGAMSDPTIDRFIKPENDYCIILTPGEEKRFADDVLIEVTRGPRKHWAIKTKRNAQGVKVCALLDGEIGKTAKCSVHTIKPQICKNFRIGSLACKLYRENL
jgi:Fe-S-cluster containining protein